MDARWKEWFDEMKLPLYVQKEMYEAAKDYASIRQKNKYSPKIGMPYGVSGNAGGWFGFINGFVFCYTLFRRAKAEKADNDTNEHYSG